MKIHTNSIRLTTTVKTGETNITEMVEAILLESKVSNGTALVSTGHTTASIHLNNADEGLEVDLHNILNDIVPNKPEFKHNKGDFGRNADAHIKCVLIGNSICVPITNGRLALGQWQAIYFSEFDGPRKRLINVKITGE